MIAAAMWPKTERTAIQSAHRLPAKMPPAATSCTSATISINQPQGCASPTSHPAVVMKIPEPAMTEIA